MTRPHAWRGRRLALAALVLAALNLRTAVTSLTPLLAMVGASLHFGTTVAAVLGTLAPASFALFAVLTPWIDARLGLERTTLLAMLLAGLGLLVRAFVGGPLGLVAASFLALAGMGIGNVVLPPLVKRYFADRIGSVSALYITSLQLGTMLPAFVAVPMAQAFGWRVALGAWALPALLAAIPLLPLLRRARDGRRDALHVAPPDGARVARSPVAWALGTLMGMTSLVTYAMFTWIPRWFVDAGASPARGGALLGVYSGVGLVSTFVVPMLAARMRQPAWLVAIAVLLHAVGYAGLLAAPLAFADLWAALLGLAGATFPLALTLINLRTRTPAGSARLSGFVQSMGYTLACAGPLVVGALRDASGGWRTPVAFLAACIAVMAVGGWHACRPRALEDDWVRSR
ncbi:MFS transporter [Cognatilysobacter segetis]|uniref:MFS transporter n=1 Tax=Cognatilysobacter segetis TaxID=2492394 RepID=UPI001060D45A|nr:MFS transporter [Lysobacter segetis]